MELFIIAGIFTVGIAIGLVIEKLIFTVFNWAVEKFIGDIE